MQLKGPDESIPGHLLSALKAVLTVYTVPELSQFSMEKTRQEWPKGNKSVGVHKLAEALFHEINCLHEAAGHSLPVEWPPGDNHLDSKTETETKESKMIQSGDTKKSEGTTLT